MENYVDYEENNLNSLQLIERKTVSISKLFDQSQDESAASLKQTKVRVDRENYDYKEKLVFAKNKIIPFQKAAEKQEEIQRKEPKKEPISIKKIFDTVGSLGNILTVARAAIPLLTGALSFLVSPPGLVLATIAALTIVAFKTGFFRNFIPQQPEPEQAPPAAPAPSPGAPAPAPKPKPQPKGTPAPKAPPSAPKPKGKVRPIAIFAGHADDPAGSGASLGDIRNDYQSWKPIGQPLTLEAYLTPLTAAAFANKLNAKGYAATYYPPIKPLSKAASGANSNWSRGEKLFKQGYTVIEIHYDAANVGRAGLIQRKALGRGDDPVEAALNKNYGRSFGRNWHRARYALDRGVNLLETAAVNNTLHIAARKGKRHAEAAVQQYADRMVSAIGQGGPDAPNNNQVMFAPVPSLNTIKETKRPVGSVISSPNIRDTRQLVRLIR